MELAWLIFAVTVTVVVVPIAYGRKNRALAEDWASAARAAGFRDIVGTTSAGSRRLEATLGALRVTLTGGGSQTSVRIDGLAQGLVVSRRAQSTVARLLERVDIETGDPAFDRELVVKSEPLLARALLSAETRALLLELALQRDEFGHPRPVFDGIQAGRMAVRVSDDRVPRRAERLARALETVMALCERLTEPESLEFQLARNIASEPEPLVRLRAVELLIAERRDHHATEGALRTALADPDERIRLAAALALDADGQHVLRAFALDPESLDAHSSRAIDSLGAALGAADAARVLEVALRGDRTATALACLASPALASGAEPILASALAHANDAVRESAARALGRVGGVAAVPALRDLERSDSDGVSRAAREAVASIQSRLVGAARGQLSVAPASGEVSLADDAQGRLSEGER